jgi:hypothetical protein
MQSWPSRQHTGTYGRVLYVHIQFYDTLSTKLILFQLFTFIYRKYRHQSSDFKRMEQLLKEKKLVLTPNGTYDDLVILKIAAKKDAVVVSNDHYQDIFKKEKTSEGKLVETAWACSLLIL